MKKPTKFDREKFLRDAKEVRETFTAEELEPTQKVERISMEDNT